MKEVSWKRLHQGRVVRDASLRFIQRGGVWLGQEPMRKRGAVSTDHLVTVGPTQQPLATCGRLSSDMRLVLTEICI